MQPLAAGFWMVAAAGLAMAAIWFTTTWLLGMAEEAPVKERAKTQVDAVRTGLAAGAGTGAAVALLLAFRRQSHQEYDTAERRVTELYNAAAEQLDSDKAPVRLTALSTLERLANDNPAHRQTIVNIICAYLRMPYSPPGPDGQREAARRYRAVRAGLPPDALQEVDPREERQVRLAAQNILRGHLHPRADVPWRRLSLDLSGAALIDFRLADCTLQSANFAEASFIGPADFAETSFAADVEFDGASFSERAGFEGAFFARPVDFGGVAFEGPVHFARAIFLGRVGFTGVPFTESVDFRGADFFASADFAETFFAGAANFSGVHFRGATTFSRADFADDATFNWSRFDGVVDLQEAYFAGVADYDGARGAGPIVLWGARVADPAQDHAPPPGWEISAAADGAGRFKSPSAGLTLLTPGGSGTRVLAPVSWRRRRAARRAAQPTGEEP